MPYTHSTPYGYDVGNHTYHQNRADPSGNLQVAPTGPWADGMIEDTDQIVSKLTDISPNISLIASRSNNIQNKLSENSDGTGDTCGEMIKEITTDMDGVLSILNPDYESLTLAGTATLLVYASSSTTSIDMSVINIS